ncbi:ABC1 kinase family protein [Carboxydothermus pertinax]|uniref:ABC1 atypical kinase-like domain-containing protein n=1 Tax=Carboxydothermus pertinax TaxID=870242 RepID=A0A1L8CUF1_9THEO|nr:AarF/ABC1/UbiB kinase family protein [Carboxydothermus pertinax]GAV22479.1 hypothetical protein cpu_09890 [Carboxydothermus pertinax]
MLPLAPKHLSRFREIAGVLTEFGFGFLLAYIRRPNNVEKIDLNDYRMTELAGNLKKMLEKLGPTFIKLGQILSTQKDILPKPFQEALEKLQDQVTPLPFREIASYIEENLDSPLEEIFIEFDENPIASASLGQVYRAKLQDEKEVVVKVKRPGVDDLIKTDLQILYRIASFIENKTNWGKLNKPLRMWEELKLSLERELDYTGEARNIDNFRKNVKYKKLIIPKVFWEFTNENILVLEAVYGVKVSERSRLLEMGIDLDRLARDLVEIFVMQILEDGYFHADPHPGNIAVTPLGEIILYDFGMVGFLNPWLKEILISLLISVVKKDFARISELLIELSHREDITPAEIKKDVRDIFNQYYFVSLAYLSLGELLKELLILAKKHEIVIPPEIVLVAKTIIALEGIVKTLNSGLSVAELAEPIATSLLKSRVLKLPSLKKIALEIYDLFDKLTALPGMLESSLANLEKAKLTLKLEERQLDKLTNSFTKSVQFLAVVIFYAAYFLSSPAILKALPLEHRGKMFLFITVAYFSGGYILWKKHRV